MGFYVNPTDGRSKEKFLDDVKLTGASEVPPDGHYDEKNDAVAVCLVVNSGFTAAAIAYSESERQAFAYPDGRYKLWIMVPVSSVEEFLFGQKIEGRNYA